MTEALQVANVTTFEGKVTLPEKEAAPAEQQSI
jgi:hypothetical protein